MSKHFDLFVFVSKLPRGVKKAVQVGFDVTGLVLVYLIVSILGVESYTNKDFFLVGLLFVFSSQFGLAYAAVYGTVIRFSGIRLLESIAAAQLISVITVAVVAELFLIGFSLVSLLLLYFFSVFFLGGIRLLAREFLYLTRPTGGRVLIYGTGKVGMQLLTSIRQVVNVIGFINDSESLIGSHLHGLPVFSSTDLVAIVKKENISMVVLASPTANREELRDLMEVLEPLSVIVKTLPKISDLLEGKESIGSLEEVRIEELLGRDSVVPDEELMTSNIFNKVILVTGAGGSIGSELCRQIISRSPKKLILVEHSELALYEIEQELAVEWGHLLVPVLASITDLEKMKNIMAQENVQNVYHAAAYKHVPLVEKNPFSAIYNNVFGTQNVLEAAVFSGVSSFTFVSTDKAVRPTNIMGASKRLAEILCQIYGSVHFGKISIAMVRFGNVIGSSGSVIPKFRTQIRNKGPVTVTHPEVTRYFMIIPEAAELVLQASSMAAGGEVFVLDMGSPIKIADLVKKLIRFSGNIVGDPKNPREDAIDVEYIGLRPGEKLYEELLISGAVQSTIHPKISKIEEAYPEAESFQEFLIKLRAMCEKKDDGGLRELLQNSDIGYSYNVQGSTDQVVSHANQNRAILTEPFESLKDNVDSHLPQLDSVAIAPIVYEDNKIEKQGCNDDNQSLRVRFFSYLLHKFFLASRPLTLGVRAVLINEKRQVCLVKHTYVSGWHLPGGGVDSGESAVAAIAREITEETTVRLTGEMQMVDVFHNNKVNKRDHVVLFFSHSFEQKCSEVASFEIKDCEFFSLDNLPSDLDVLSRQMIIAVLNSLSESQLSQ